MKKLLLIALSLVSATALAGGHQLVEEHCMGCHVIDGRGGEKSPAPPMYAVWHHYRQAYPQKEAFVDRMASWIEQPAQESAVMQGAMMRFGVMERVALNEGEAREIAEYLHDHPFALPEAYVKHYDENHGKPSHGYTRPENH